MSNNDYRHIHHIVSTQPLPLFDNDRANDALHYTQDMDDNSVRDEFN